MSESTLQRVYPYNFKTISYKSYMPQLHASIYNLCNQKLYLRMVPPDDFLEWKNLSMQLQLAFNPAKGIPAADLKLVSVGVVQELPFPIEAVPEGKRIVLNKSVPNTATKLVVDIDLTTMIDPTGPNYVELVFPPSFLYLDQWGNMEIWKLDALYTTRGIR